MEWFKINANDVLYTHDELTDREFRLLIKSMALTASLENMPNDKTLVKLGHHKTLTSLQEGLKTCPRNLQEMLKDVLRDSQEYLKKKLYNRSKKRQERERLSLESENVNIDKRLTSQLREEKRREEKKTKDKNINKSIYNELTLSEEPKFIQYSQIDPQTYQEAKPYRDRVINVIYDCYDNRRRGDLFEVSEVFNEKMGEDVKKDLIPFLFSFNSYLESEEYKKGIVMNLKRFVREWENYKVDIETNESLDGLLFQFEQKFSTKELTYA
jgi:hypothetical protein